MKMFSLKPGFQTQLGITGTCLQAFFLLALWTPLPDFNEANISSFGYDQGVFGGLVTNTDFLEVFGNPNPTLLGLIVSIYNIGCILGCVLTFAVGARFGRRQAIWTAMMMLCVGAVLQTSAYSVPQMMVGRVITGIGVGIDTSTVPTYQSELCKASHRGRLVTTEVRSSIPSRFVYADQPQVLFTAVGVSFAYFFSFALSYVGGVVGWRLPIALQMVFAVPVVIALFALPETPRWLMQKGRVEESIQVMMHVFNLPELDPYIQEEKSRISRTIHLEEESSFTWATVLKKDALQTRWGMFLACLVLTMNQWAGINVVVFYASVVLEENVGLLRQTALVVGGCLNLAFAVGSLLPSVGLDRLGRRMPMMIGSFAMAVSMMLVAILLSFNGTAQETVTASVSIAFFMTFMIAFGTSLNAIPWCYSAEILPLKIRAKGAALALFCNWVSVFIIVMVTPTLVTDLQWKTYLIFMSANFAFVPIIYFLFPETTGKSLEEIDYIFLKGHDLPLGSIESRSASTHEEAYRHDGKTQDQEHLESR